MTPESTWDTLREEIKAWTSSGGEAQFWLRDDDAIEATPRLDWLLEQCNEFQVPLALAVIPKNLKASLIDRLKNESLVTVLQHGFQHINHGQGSGRAGEFEYHRPHDEMLHELREGKEILARAFGDKFLPVLVPPWNKIDPTLVPKLGSAGLMGLSTFNPRESKNIAGIKIANTHCDIIKWKPAAHFRGEAKNNNDFVEHLENRRHERCDRAEATGYLTHHLDHDKAADKYTRDFFSFTTQNGARWLSANEIFRKEQA